MDVTAGHIAVFVTVPDEEKGAGIGKAVVDEGLAACCSIVPRIRSIYRWKGEVCDEGEALCVMKTRAELFERLKSRVRELHPYEVPEIIAFGIEAGLSEYLSWIDSSTER